MTRKEFNDRLHALIMDALMNGVSHSDVSAEIEEAYIMMIDEANSEDSE